MIGLHFAFSARKVYHRDEVFLQLFGSVLMLGCENFGLIDVVSVEDSFRLFLDLGFFTVDLLIWRLGFGFRGISGFSGFQICD